MKRVSASNASESAKGDVFRSLIEMHSGSGMKCVPPLFSEAIDKRFLRRPTAPNMSTDPAIVTLDNALFEFGLLFEDCALLEKSEIETASDLNHIKMLLYGANSLPILKREMMPIASHHHMYTEMRRQFLIETLMSTGSVVEYRMFAKAMVEKGMWGGINDLEIRPMWDAWVSALTQRIQLALDSGAKLKLERDRDELPHVKRGSSQLERRANMLLAEIGVKAETLANVALISALSEICSPDKSKSTNTGRGSNATVDFDVFSAELRKWTNTDIESSIVQELEEVGRASVVHLSDVVGSAVLFEANFELAKAKKRTIRKPATTTDSTLVPFDWSKSDKVIVGSELLSVMQSECMLKMSAGEAKAQLAGANSLNNRSEHAIDPETDLYFVRDIQMKNRAVSVSMSTSASKSGSQGQEVLINAFTHSVEHRGFRSTGYISIRRELVDKIASVLPRNGFYRLAPMVIPPAPWKDFWLCGFMTRRSPLVRFTGTRDGARDAKMFNMDTLRNGLDYLGSTKWRVHAKIVESIDSAVQSKRSDVPGIPKESDLISSRANLKAIKEASYLSKVQRRTDLMRILKEKQTLQNEGPILTAKLQTAKQFIDAPALYFPHSIDFRGRVYPIPAPFNHQADDVVRAMLRFGDPKPLGARGWYWLRVHCANLFGMDKLTLDQRVDWVENNLSDIIKVGTNPLSEESVGFVASRTEDFWQALAACMEIQQAVNHNGKSNNPESFPSSLPVHQDGSCNGLQHYAALGRDTLGALAVNLIPSEKVEDVYSFVLGIVKEQTQKHAALFSHPASASLDELAKICPSSFSDLKSEDPKVQAILAQICLAADGILVRKTVKQTVMTICYGVTQLGASDQMAKQLGSLELSKKLTSGQLSVLATYLARLTLNSVDAVFKQAMEIKRWLDTVSSLANEHKIPVSWVSPAGVPCRQPYRKNQVTEIRTPLQKITLMDESQYDVAPVSKIKQRLGFPPNFIHSLDASHMLLTCIQCKQAGIAFASVHDSFWTHACDVDTMSSIIRQEFVRMYQDTPVLTKLRDSVVLSLGAHGSSLPPLPEQGELDLTCVLNSKYFFD